MPNTPGSVIICKNGNNSAMPFKKCSKHRLHPFFSTITDEL